MDLSTYSLKNKVLVISILIVLFVGGFLAYMRMSKLEDPELTVKTAVVVAIYPGASAHQVELEAIEPLEKAISSMTDVELVESTSYNDMGIVKIELATTVQDSEVPQDWDLLRRKVHDLQTSLPSSVQTVVMDDYGDVYGMFYAMTADGYGYDDIARFSNLVEREISSIEGISKVMTYGERKKCIRIDVIQEKMANFGVHPVEVVLSLNTQNSTLYPGYYEAGDQRFRIEIGGAYTSIDDISNLIIQGHEKDQLRLGDVANVYFDYEYPVRNSMAFDGKTAVGILISAKSGTDITKIGKEVKACIEQLKEERLPAGIEFEPVFFQPDIVEDSISTFLINLAESVLIVIFILMLTMGFKSGMIIGVSLIVIVFGSFLVLDMFDGTLQRVSLGAFILAMGMLVDNAIVIIDGILVDLKRGVPKQEALVNIGKKTAMPLLGATVIAILAFLPIIMSPDMAGTYVRDLFIVLAVSLLLSWVLALTHVPIHAGFSLNPEKLRGKSDGKDPFGTKPYKVLRNVLEFILSHKTVVLICALLLVLSSVWCYQYIPQMFFPDMSYDQMYIEYSMPEGTKSEKVEADLIEMENYLRQNDNVLHITRSVGGTPGRYCLVRAIADPTMSYGELIVQCKDRKKMVNEIERIQSELIEMFPQAYLRIKQYNLMYRPFPIEACFTGPDPAVLKDLAAQAEEIMEESDATYLVTNNWSEPGTTLSVEYNQSMARAAGVSRSDAAVSLLAAAGGIPCGSYLEDDSRLKIYLHTTDPEGNQLDNISNAPVWSLTPSVSSVVSKENISGLVMGYTSKEDILSNMFASVPLNQVSDSIHIKWEDAKVCRRNEQRAIKVQCNNAPGYTAESARTAIKDAVEAIELPVGYSLTWLGEYDASQSSTKYLFKNVPLAIVLMILIMIALFKDLKKPSIILLCLPLIAVGVVYGMLISGKDFGFVAIVGSLGIIGMMIKNGIVLIDEIDRQIGEGKEPYNALVDSTLSRFRPVIMASMTTVLGMVPLLGDPLFGSLAVTIMSGLTVGTLIVLLFLPVLYAVFFRVRKKS